MVSQIGEAWLIKDRGFQDTQMVSNDAEVGLHCRGAQIVLDFGAWYGLVHIYIYILLHHQLWLQLFLEIPIAVVPLYVNLLQYVDQVKKIGIAFLDDRRW